MMFATHFSYKSHITRKLLVELFHSDNDLLTDILIYHLVGGAVYSTDLGCDSEVVIANGQTSGTFCESKDIF
jgi:hypothetical protein